jgi:hypothetical protein
MGLYAQVSGPARNKTLTKAKNEARDAFKAKARIMLNFRLKNPIIPAAGLADAGAAAPDRTHTPVGTPTEHLGLTIIPANRGRRKIVRTVEETGSKAAPAGYGRAALRKGSSGARRGPAGAGTAKKEAAPTPHTPKKDIGFEP